MPRTPKVLIVDYDPKALRSMQELFSRAGYLVDTARDGEAALSSVKRSRPDIVLLEALIPKKSGFEVCQSLKKAPETRTTPVIIMTAVYKGRKYRTDAMHVHGCDEYVEKPCSSEVLLEVVGRFVPPGTEVRAAAVGQGDLLTFSGHEKRGEVIPFPAERSAFTLPEMTDDAEQEIMSKLDAILPNTPLFEESALGQPRSEAETGEPNVVDFDIDEEPDPSTAEAAAPEPEPPAARRESEPPSPAAAPAAAGAQRRRTPRAMDPKEVEKLTRPKRAHKRAAERAKRPAMISGRYLFFLGAAVVLTIVAWLIGRV